MESLGLLYVVFVLFGLLLAILWICMPFAVFGTKDKLQTLIDETRANTAAVRALHDTMKES